MNPDAFIITYPPDTWRQTVQGNRLQPEVLLRLGTAFQLYKNVMTPEGAEGVMGMGSWNSKTSAGAKAYFDAHTNRFGGKEPIGLGQRPLLGRSGDPHRVRGGGRPGPQGHPRPHCQERVQHHRQDPIGSEVSVPGTVGQWEKGEFEIVWPASMAMAQ